jgi:hypothetical protein
MSGHGAIALPRTAPTTLIENPGFHVVATPRCVDRAARKWAQAARHLPRTERAEDVAICMSLSDLTTAALTSLVSIIIRRQCLPAEGSVMPSVRLQPTSRMIVA